MPHIALDYEIVEHDLDNGLRVIVNHDPGAPAEAVNLWYAVGSGDETLGVTGFAHLFEHLMFAGSAHVAASEHLALMESAGGSANATTSFDRTNYFETVPPGALELALWLEADRMSTLAVNQANFDTQVEVVKEEKRQRYDNVPYGDQLELLLKLNFPPEHPYGHPTIGSMSDLDAASLSDVQGFYRRWYHPGGAVLTLSGPVGADKAVGLVEKYFADIPAAPAQDARPFAPLPRHEDVPTIQVRRAVPSTMVHLCWRSPDFNSPQRYAVEQALAVLASGQSSRLPSLLVRDREIADAVGSGDFGLARGVSMASLSARVRSGHSPQELCEAILEQLVRLAEQGPDEAELARVNAGFDREWLTRLASVDSRADEISGFASLSGDPHMVNSLLTRMHAVTADQIAEAAGTWLAPEHRAVLIYEAEDAR
ncbi:Peptidase M16, C-terminal [Propionibacterium ruminifibrarum]|uniref:Peptidase M16, C-terminal n=1 Tax=Propionibacterium ruminifibrarum TaxID=1962131 RepID=A0A375I278_9ACTN|nr:pitrilysin family protein [Propionibacterium ruminifibrarum]SPF67246.1 Peptidase M16, C-terminal [Propionibacterium ruminifibrarum]